MKISTVAAVSFGYIAFLGLTYLIGNTSWTLWGVLPAENTTLRESIYASAIEDSLFFTLVTLITILASTPAFQALDTRLQHVYSNKKASDRIKSKIRESAMNLGIYSPTTEVDMHIREYNSDLRAFKIEISVIVHLASAIPDCHYTRNRTIDLTFDDFGDMKSNPYGELKWVQTTSSKAGETPKIQHRIPREFTAKNDSFSITEKIDGNEDTTVQFHYWLWSKNGEIFSYAPARKTEKFTLEITNHLTKDVKLEYKHETSTLKLSKRICQSQFVDEEETIDFLLTAT